MHWGSILTNTEQMLLYAKIKQIFLDQFDFNMIEKQFSKFRDKYENNEEMKSILNLWANIMLFAEDTQYFSLQVYSFRQSITDSIISSDILTDWVDYIWTNYDRWHIKPDLLLICGHHLLLEHRGKVSPKIIQKIILLNKQIEKDVRGN